MSRPRDLGEPDLAPCQYFVESTRAVLGKLLRRNRRTHDNGRIAVALAKAAAAAPLRTIDPADPLTWEFSGFSQNGEDGIIDFLSRKVLVPNRFFIEIGAFDGVENNTAWLAIARKYRGIMVEADAGNSKLARKLMQTYNVGVECIPMFVTKASAAALKARAFCADPDVFSIDIDGNDLHVAQVLLEAGFRPRIFVVEYNSAFGPERPLTIPYRDDFDLHAAHPSGLYYGASVAAWKAFFARHGYRFLTVESCGVNAFFVDPRAFPADFIGRVQGADYRENAAQFGRFRGSWEKQFALIRHLPFVEIA